MGMQNLLTWVNAESNPPDDDVTVLIFAPILEEPVWMGYLEDGIWYLVEGEALHDGIVTHWSDFPPGPDTQQ